MALFDEIQTDHTEPETTTTAETEGSTQVEAKHQEAVHAQSAPATPGPGTRNEKETMEDFATVLENFENQEAEVVADDHVIRGTVLKITSTHVFVDIGMKSEGLVPIEEVKDHDGNVTVNPGDEIDVMVEKGETEEGYPKLSHQKAKRLRAWDEIEKAYNERLR